MHVICMHALVRQGHCLAQLNFHLQNFFFETALKTAVRIREKIGRRMLKNAIALCNSEEDIYIISE